MNDIWQFQQTLTRRLSLGAGVSLLLGLGMFLKQGNLPQRAQRNTKKEPLRFSFVPLRVLRG